MKLILLAFVLRPILRRPLRFFGTVLGVAVGVGSVVATVAANRAAVASFEEGVRQIAGRSRLEVTAVGGLPQSLLGRLRPFCRDAHLVPVIEEITLVPRLGESVRVLGIDLLIDGEARNLGLSEPEPPEEIPGVSSSFPASMLRGEGLFLARKLAEELEVEASDELEILARSRPIRFSVGGVFEAGPLGEVWERVLVVDVSKAQEIFGRGDRLDRIELVLRKGVELEDLRSRVQQVLGEGFRVASPEVRRKQTSRAVRALRFNLTALSGISLLVGAVLVATTLATSVVQRRRWIAELRSLGASKAQVLGAIVLEAAAVGSLGGVLGVIGGGLGAEAALASVRATAAVVVPGATATGIHVSNGLGLAGLLLGMIVGLAAAILPGLEAIAVPPVQGLKAVREDQSTKPNRFRWILWSGALVFAGWLGTRMPPVGELPVIALLGSLAFLGALLVLTAPFLALLTGACLRLLSPARFPTLRLAAATLIATLRRSAWAAGAVGVAVALSIAIGAMVSSFRTTVIDWTEQSLRSDLWIRPLRAETGVTVGRLDPEIVEVTERLFGASNVDPFYWEEAFVGDRKITFGGGNFQAVAQRGGVPYKSGRDSGEILEEAKRVGGAVVNEPFSNRYGKGAGETIRVRTAAGILEKKIVDVFYDYSNDRGLVIVDKEIFLDHVPDEGPRTISVFLEASADPSAERERLLDALGGKYAIEVLRNRNLKQEVLAVFDRTFAITTGLKLVSAVVAAIAVLTVLSALVFERRRELGVLRALGSSRGQIVGLVLGQAGLLGLVAASTGLLFGLLVGWVLVTTVNVQSFGWTLRFLPPWSDVGWTMVWVVVACLLAGLIPARSASRLPPGTVLRTEDQS